MVTAGASPPAPHLLLLCDPALPQRYREGLEGALIEAFPKNVLPEVHVRDCDPPMTLPFFDDGRGQFCADALIQGLADASTLPPSSDDAAAAAAADAANAAARWERFARRVVLPRGGEPLPKLLVVRGDGFLRAPCGSGGAVGGGVGGGGSVTASGGGGEATASSVGSAGGVGGGGGGSGAPHEGEGEGEEQEGQQQQQHGRGLGGSPPGYCLSATRLSPAPPAAVVFTARLHGDPQRIATQVVHEAGHMQGLGHCSPPCVMAPVHTEAESQRRLALFCDECWWQLLENK